MAPSIRAKPPRRRCGFTRASIAQIGPFAQCEVFLLSLLTVRVAIDTHGCRLNQFESDAMAQALRQAGHELVDSVAQAQVYVLNSCTVTHRADADARRAVRRVRRDREDLSVVLTGCHVDADPQAAGALPGVDLALGNARKAELVELLEVVGAARERESVEPAEPSPTLIAASALTRRMPFVPLPAATPHHRSRAMLKVQDGCNYRCAFCIVPKVRGSSRSLSIADAVGQARTLVEAGVPEIVLTGVHLGTYGRDLRPRRRFSELVAELLAVLGPDTRLRLSSIDPQEVDDELVELLVAHPGRLCPHLHLPVQAADNGILRAMRRGHTVETFEALVQRAVQRVPGLAIGSDVITGFPGEDEAAFLRGYERLTALPLAYLHVFPFSARRDTPAASMPDQVDPAVRSARVAKLRAASAEMIAAHRRRRADTVADVVLHRRPSADGSFEALSDDFLRVRLRLSASHRELAGARVRVRIGPDGREASPIP